MPLITVKTIIKAPQDVVFDLSRSIDLHKISAEGTKETAIAGVTSGLINLNESVTWKAKHFGIYHTLTSKITAFNAYEQFVDEMVLGPFKYMRHEHRFQSEGNATLMTDHFKYESPLGFLGKLADTLFLKSYLQQFLEQRNQVIKSYAESADWRQILHKRSYF